MQVPQTSMIQGWLSGRAVIVAAQGPDVGYAVASGLAARDAKVVLLSDEAEPGRTFASRCRTHSPMPPARSAVRSLSS
jgi:NAD(P)-dependent dehydrogenase (short-subunit alcohol dehydrogenase family)